MPPVPDEVMVRPELIELDSPERHRVLDQIAAKKGHCDSCGGTEFEVGAALYLGFLFLDEDTDAYMIALTCRNRDCARPRTGVVLHENEFRRL
ncbi:hypothetical protein E2F47_19615 [Mycobacterium eburneum]|nr:hypothetical protein [Mycobacterium eburneum]TDH49752.1 hypothetical protein E2F47_19615 [Mycobacterium eburneum]